MASESTDTIYAYAQLGLAYGASFERIQQVLSNALAYRFATRARTDEVQRFVDFFAARRKFGELELSFTEIRARYYQNAKAYHPDTTPGDKAAEERLKAVNAAYEIIDKVHREARVYFRKDEAVREEIEKQAREAAQREAEASGGREASAPPHQTYAAGKGANSAHEWPYRTNVAASPLKYMAASVPRYIRMSRLFYLPQHSIIGNRFIQYNAGKAMVYDVIMLTEREFMRARLSLGIEAQGTPELAMSRLTPAYIPTDTRMVLVPETEESPYAFAKKYFIEKFSLSTVAA